MNFKSEGVVLARKNFQEADRLVTFYTKDFGKITCIAKGVKKPTSRKSGHIELATHCTLFIAKGKNLDILTEVETKRAYGLENLAGQKTLEVYQLLELIDHLTPVGQKNREVFSLLVDFLDCVKAQNNYNLLIAAFKIKLLSTLGFFSATNIKNSASQQLIAGFESKSLKELEESLKENNTYLKLLAFLDSIIEKITDRKLKTNRFIHAQI